MVFQNHEFEVNICQENMEGEDNCRDLNNVRYRIDLEASLQSFWSQWPCQCVPPVSMATWLSSLAVCGFLGKGLQKMGRKLIPGMWRKGWSTGWCRRRGRTLDVVSIAGSSWWDHRWETFQHPYNHYELCIISSAIFSLKCSHAVSSWVQEDVVSASLGHHKAKGMVRKPDFLGCTVSLPQVPDS